VLECELPAPSTAEYRWEWSLKWEWMDRMRGDCGRV
jgi:hypothetical protein